MSMEIRKIGKLTYARAKSLLNGRLRMKIGHNTYLAQTEETFTVIYHKTDIITFFSNDVVRLNTDGHKTTTTKARLNILSWYYVYQRKNVWYVIDENGYEVEFYDGIYLGRKDPVRTELEKASQAGDTVAMAALHDYQIDTQ